MNDVFIDMAVAVLLSSIKNPASKTKLAKVEAKIVREILLSQLGNTDFSKLVDESILTFQSSVEG